MSEIEWIGEISFGDLAEPEKWLDRFIGELNKTKIAFEVDYEDLSIKFYISNDIFYPGEEKTKCQQ
mgnify:FL=1